MNLSTFVGNHCQREATLTIVSSECSIPLAGVRIYSRNYMVIVSASNGRYRIRTCSLPLYVTLQKYGFRTMRVIVRRSAEKFTMRCLGTCMFYHCYVASFSCLCYLRIEMQIFSLNWMMQNIRLFNVCEARRASRRH